MILKYLFTTYLLITKKKVSHNSEKIWNPAVNQVIKEHQDVIRTEHYLCGIPAR